MKKLLLILMAASVSLAMLASDKLSAPTRVFLQQRANAVAQAPDGKSVLAMPKTLNGVEYVECFITLNGSSIAELEANGVKVTGKFSDFVTASIPVSKRTAVQFKGNFL